MLLSRFSSLSVDWSPVGPSVVFGIVLGRIHCGGADGGNGSGDGGSNNTSGNRQTKDK